MSGRATFAIVDTRLRAERARGVRVRDRCGRRLRRAARVGRSGFFLLDAGHRRRTGAKPGRFPHLDLCEQGAPLFGRELARARALVPCIIVVLATFAYVAAAAALRDCARFRSRSPSRWRRNPSTLIALSPRSVPARRTCSTSSWRAPRARSSLRSRRRAFARGARWHSPRWCRFSRCASTAKLSPVTIRYSAFEA